MSASSVTVRTKLALPPYGKELRDARARGQFPNVYIHAGARSWERSKWRVPPEILILPPEDNFHDYQWNGIAGLAVMLVVWDRPNAFIDAFARHLIISGAELIKTHLIDDDGDPEVVNYRPGRP